MRRTPAAGLVLAAAATALIGLGTPALAATWTVTPGGTTTGTSGTVTVKDTKTGTSVTCTSSSVTASLQSGTGLSGTGLGTVSGATVTNCKGPLGLNLASGTVGVNLSLNADSYSAGVTTGHLSGIQYSVSNLLCSVSVAGATATTPGTVAGTYTNSTGVLALSGGDLHFWGVSGCLGLIHTGDPISIAVSYTMSPAQTITSP